MNPEYSKFVNDLWNARPTLVLMLVGGLVMFVLCVIDTHRHRKKQHKRRHVGHYHGRHH
jgi:hypothetical protein